MTKTFRKAVQLFILTFFILALGGCGEEPGPAEKTGKRIDQVLEKTADKVSDLSK